MKRIKIEIIAGLFLGVFLQADTADIDELEQRSAAD